MLVSEDYRRDDFNTCAEWAVCPGIRGYPKGQTEDGFELHFGTNHLGHFALFEGLKDALIGSSTASFASRVSTVSFRPSTVGNSL